MIVKRVNLCALDTGSLTLGYVGENDHTQIRINCASVFADYPAAVVSMTVKAPSGVVYPREVETDGQVVIWTITDSDTASAGNGQIQLTFTEDGTIVKTVIAVTTVRASLVGDNPPPDPITDWIDEAGEALAKLEGMTASATQLPAGEDPTAEVEVVDGHYNIALGIPGGDTESIIDDTAGVGDVTKVWSANKSATELSELKSEIDRKAPCIYQDASGDIVSFTDGADNMPLASCAVQIDPVQDLHGQDSPYPAGASKNVWDFAHPVSTYRASVTENANGTFSVEGTGAGANLYYIINTVAGQTYAIKIDTSGESGNTSIIGYTTVYDGTDNTGTVLMSDSNTKTTKTFTAASGNAYMKFSVTGGSGAGSATVLNPMIEAGSSRTAYAPYANICPITGHTGAQVYRTGVNVWDEQWEQGQYNTQTGEKQASNYHIRCKNPISVKPNTEYFYSTNGFNINVCYMGANMEFIMNFNSVHDVVRTTPDNCYYVVFNLAQAYGLTYNHDVSINYPATDTAYHAYTGQTYPISWQTAAGTVYGGNLTVHEDGTGKLAVGSVLEVFNQIGTGYIMSQYNAIDANLSVSVLGDTVRVNGTVRTEVDQSNINRVSSSYQYKMCNLLPHYFAYASDTAHWYRNTVLYMFFPVSLAGETRESVISYLTSIKDTNPLSFWIPLVNPVEYDLTAAEVGQIMTLKGYNAIWADTGAISLTYPADTRTYVDSAITAATDPDGNVIQVSGSTPSITGESGKRYICGTVDSLTITPPSTGIIDVVFTSGTTPTVLTVSGVTWPSWFDSTSLNASTVYDITIKDGYGVVNTWT